MLVYINYSELFNEIYQLESFKFGYFSLIYNLKNDRRKENGFIEGFENSKFYKEKLIILPKEVAQLLNLIFSRKGFIEEIKKDGLNYEWHPAINGGDGIPKNLSKYLNSIMRKDKPDFIINTILGYWSDFLNENKDLDLIINNSSIDDENKSIKFFAYINKNSHLLGKDKCLKVINYFIENISTFSAIEYSDNNLNYGLRVDSANILMRMINNINDIGEIHKIIFNNSGALGRKSLISLFVDDKNILGWYDLLLFRLLCSQDRMNDFWNIYEALKIDSKDEIDQNNHVKYLAEFEMKRISQETFKLFKNRFIDKGLNFFDEINNLSNIELFGTEQKYEYAEKFLEQKELEKIIKKTKLTITSFITYQLSNNIIDAGVGIGFYNDSDDEKSIHERMNDYLFSICFNVESDKNIEFFLDYLLSHLVLGSREEGFVPNFKNYLRVFDEDLLLGYWFVNNKRIKEYVKNLREDRVVYTNNYNASYKEDLPVVFDLLDYELEAKLLIERDELINILNFIKEKKSENSKEMD